MGVNEYSTSLDDGLWYWRVATIDSSGDRGDFSSIQSLTVDTTAPVISPQDNITIIEGTSGEYIVWSCSDAHPDSSTTTRNGEIIEIAEEVGGTHADPESRGETTDQDARADSLATTKAPS